MSDDEDYQSPPAKRIQMKAVVTEVRLGTPRVMTTEEIIYDYKSLPADISEVEWVMVSDYHALQTDFRKYRIETGKELFTIEVERDRLKERVDILSKGWPAADIIRLEAENARLTLLIKIAGELITNDNCKEAWDEAKRASDE